MEILRTIKLYCEGNQMPFLVIGGHAVNAYGVSRQTGDLDLIVPRAQKKDWHTLLIEKLSYTATQNDERFSRYRPDAIAAWPIDLMYVDDQTFTKMLSESTDADLGQAKVRVVSARHLIILKLHALKYFQSHRFSKDFTDVISLLKNNSANFSREEWHELCVKYASEDLFKKIVKELSQ